MPSQRAGWIRRASGVFSTIVPSYSDGLVPDSHRLPAAALAVGPPRSESRRPRAAGIERRLAGVTFLMLAFKDQYRGSETRAIVSP